MLKTIIKFLLKKCGYDLKSTNQPRAFWENNKDFVRLYEMIKDKTLVDADRCFMIYQYANLVKHKGGEAAELGVYKGGTAKMLGEVFKNKEIYLFDTFEGMPKTDGALDLHKQGDFQDTSLTNVSSYLVDYKNLIFKKGFFPETAKGLEEKTFCFVYLDADIYESTASGLNFFYDRMVDGGVIVVDDYEGKNCPGVKIAVDEFAAQKHTRPIVTARAQCVLFKN